MPAAMAELWQWHSLEELEHKSVAFDVYNQIGGSYKMRIRVMRFAMFILSKDTLSVTIKMLRQKFAPIPIIYMLANQRPNPPALVNNR
jgi:predicted metal-dependent hydrolase